MAGPRVGGGSARSRTQGQCDATPAAGGAVLGFDHGSATSTGKPAPGIRARHGPVARAGTGLGLAGCGADGERHEAGAAADRFAADVAADPAAACALLAPRTLESVEKDGTPCPQALPEDDLPTPGSRGVVSVAGHSAQVRYAGDTVFLALFDDGWRVTAAGCSRTSDDPATPYDCAIEGS